MQLVKFIFSLVVAYCIAAPTLAEYSGGLIEPAGPNTGGNVTTLLAGDDPRNIARQSLGSQPGSKKRQTRGKIRSIQERDSTSIDAGEMIVGTSIHKLTTYHVKNCVAVAAYDPGTKEKVMAHINAMNSANHDYRTQTTNFVNAVKKMSTSPEITIRLPVQSDWINNLSSGAYNQLGVMITYIHSAVNGIDGTDQVTAVTRKDKVGSMAIHEDGDVEVD